MSGSSRLKKISLSVLGVLALVIAGIAVLFPTQTYLFALFMITNITANHHPPPLAQGVITDNDWLKWDQGSRKFTAALNKRFPPGTPESEVRTVLDSQGFKNLPPPAPDCIPEGQTPPIGRSYTTCPPDDRWKRTMDYRWGGLPCDQSLSATWFVEKRGRVVRLEGHYGGGCL